MASVLDSATVNTILSFVAPAVMVYLGTISGLLLPCQSTLTCAQRLIAAIPLSILVSAPEAHGYLLAVQHFNLGMVQAVSLYTVLIGLWIKQGQAIGTGVLPRLSELLRRYLRAVVVVTPQVGSITKLFLMSLPMRICFRARPVAIRIQSTVQRRQFGESKRGKRQNL